MTQQEVYSKFDGYLSKWNGKKQEVVDSTNKYQCVDLQVGWISMDQDGAVYLGIPRETTAHTYAFQIWTNATDLTRQYFDLIPNSPTGVPQKGDVVVFKSGWSGSYAGHVGVCTGRADVKTFDLFEQNDPIGSPCHVKTYSEYDYNFVLGWLRPKTSNPVPESPEKYKEALRKIRDIVNQTGV